MGSILVGPTVERNQHEEIRRALLNVSPAIAASAGYITNAPVPNYQELVGVVARVKAIERRLKESPVVLLE